MRIKEIIKIPYSIYLCLRFPFLYPRNRFTDRHYTNWYLKKKIENIVNKYPFNRELLAREPFSKKDKIKIKFFNICWDILSIFHCIPIYTELDAMPKGWRKAFGIQMCKEIKRSLKEHHVLSKFRIEDIKEKFGTLRFYYNAAPDEVSDIVQKYEYISYYTCIVCGKPAPFVTEGWISPYCEEHAPNGCKERREFYGWTQSRYRIKGSDETFKYSNESN